MRRLDQLLANLGYCSRREVRDWLKAGRVRIDGAPASDPGARVRAAAVTVDGEALDRPDGVLLLLNKPCGLVCSHDAREGPSVYDLFPPRWRRRNPVVTTVGRLDKETSGALLVTDQSELVHRLTSPRRHVAKVYRATVDRPLEPGLADVFRRGDLVLQGEDEPCAPAELAITAPTVAELTLTEGKYHQVRRMFASQGYHVVALHRLRFGELDLQGVPEGQWRELPLDYFGGKG